jgi:hypothetical protein
VQLLADGQFALGFEHIVTGRRGLARAVEAAALQRKVIACQLAQLAGDRRLTRQHIQLHLRIGQHRQRLSGGDQRAVLNDQMVDLPPALALTSVVTRGATEARSGRASSKRPCWTTAVSRSPAAMSVDPAEGRTHHSSPAAASPAAPTSSGRPRHHGAGALDAFIHAAAA